MIDSYKHKGMRHKLAEAIRDKGITDERIIEAINKIPRHLFMDSSFEKFAYSDVPFPIGSGQTISQPYTVAVQTELLEVKKGDKILEIGTGSGYQACVLLEMGAKVYSIERQRNLFDKTRLLLPSLGYNPKMFYGDGYKGLPAFAPFDKVIVTAGAIEVPEDVLKQLQVGGIMVIPVGNEKTQKMIRIKKISENEFDKSENGNFAFVPFLKDKVR
ncbi:MAG: protein-L-isoaspartate O-methyltransferase [Bacteroidetes bacterium CG2_30_33_31]|nr:MAG: protein-L-isoaspartate O-methyltransferase [Bacteroidetes bacterium CG2_30_33_31]